MSNQTQTPHNDMGTLAEDARLLMAATADVAGEKVSEARKRLAAALERGKEIYGRVREKAVEGAKATDKAVHEHPYPAVGIASALARCSAISSRAGAAAMATDQAMNPAPLHVGQLFETSKRFVRRLLTIGEPAPAMITSTSRFFRNSLA